MVTNCPPENELNSRLRREFVVKWFLYSSQAWTKEKAFYFIVPVMLEAVLKQNAIISLYVSHK